MSFISNPFSFINYDSSYQAILDYATAQGYTLPTLDNRIKQNEYLRWLKSIGAWNNLDILYVFATDGDQNYAGINWKNPGNYNILRVGTPTYTSKVGFTASSGNYLNTQWSPRNNGVNFQQDDCSFGLYVNTEVAGDTVDMGCSDNADGLTSSMSIISRRTTPSQLKYRILDSTDLVANSASIGFHHAKRLGTTSNRKYAFKNGVLGNSAATVSSLRPVSTVFIGASNGNGSAVLSTTRQYSMAFAGNSLNGIELNMSNYWSYYFINI
jgi:hypothetical protein